MAASLTPATDPARFDCLGFDLALCRAEHKQVNVPFLLGLGWRLEDLEASEDFETRAAARAYALACASNQQATMVGLLLTLAAASLILLYGLSGPALRGLI